MAEKRLTTEIAEQFLADEDSVDLSEFTEVDDDAAESLSKHEGNLLDLAGLTSLSDEAAESLSNHKGKYLFLHGLTSLSDEAAESLSKYKGDLSLNGLTQLSETAGHIALAESLSENVDDDGELILDGLTSLSDAAAESLSKCQTGLSLTGLTSLSDATAESLSKHKGEYLDLGGLTRLSDAAADGERIEHVFIVEGCGIEGGHSDSIPGPIVLRIRNTGEFLPEVLRNSGCRGRTVEARLQQRSSP